jgi:hypothetical protein
VVGFVYLKYNKEIGNELSKKSTFFTDFLGVCGSLTYAGALNSPYLPKQKDASPSETISHIRRRIKVLPREFYGSLIDAVASPPHHRGTCVFDKLSNMESCTFTVQAPCVFCRPRTYHR